VTLVTAREGRCRPLPTPAVGPCFVRDSCTLPVWSCVLPVRSCMVFLRSRTARLGESPGRPGQSRSACYTLLHAIHCYTAWRTSGCRLKRDCERNLLLSIVWILIGIVVSNFDVIWSRHSQCRQCPHWRNVWIARRMHDGEDAGDRLGMRRYGVFRLLGLPPVRALAALILIPLASAVSRIAS
jgi:hypothetical protein